MKKLAATLLGIVLLQNACMHTSERRETSNLLPENTFTAGIEGPATDKAGNLYAVNYREEGTIGIITPTGEARIYVTLPRGSVGNGIRFDRSDVMYIADYTGHAILKIMPGTTQPSVERFAYEPRMNQPNDIAITDAGMLFASDPDWKNKRGRLWRIDTKGEVTLLEEGMSTTNGIEVAPDNKTLYVNESTTRKIWAYNLDASGNIANKRLLYEFADAGLDGMRCDTQGNLYVARYDAGTVAVISPAGKLLREIKLRGKKPTNVTFGGADGKTLYITLQDRRTIEYFKNDTPGAR